MTRTPFTAETKQLLEAFGFTATEHPETWKDIGGPESGPKVVGGPAYTEWDNGKTSVYVVDGFIEEIENNPPEYYKSVEEHF